MSGSRPVKDIYAESRPASPRIIHSWKKAQSFEEGEKGKLELSRFEANALKDAKAAFEALTDDKDQFVSDCLTKYKNEVAVFLPENYGL